MSTGFRRNNDLKLGPFCALYLALAIILNDFLKACINEYWYCSKLKHHKLIMKVYYYSF